MWRARIILLTADGVGTMGIMTVTGTSKTTAWRWQERFAEGGRYNYPELQAVLIKPNSLPKLAILG